MPTLVLIRHGQSTWNLENRFTGWWDVDLTDLGRSEAKAAGEAMARAGLDFDRCFTSFQTRAIRTLGIALDAMGRLWLPVEKSWKLNERHYGGLTGLNKAETAARHGEEQVKIWRRSFDTPPPARRGAAGGVSDLRTTPPPPASRTPLEDGRTGSPAGSRPWGAAPRPPPLEPGGRGPVSPHGNWRGAVGNGRRTRPTSNEKL